MSGRIQMRHLHLLMSVVLPAGGVCLPNYCQYRIDRCYLDIIIQIIETMMGFIRMLFI